MLEKILTPKLKRLSLITVVLSMIFSCPAYAAGREVIKEEREIDINNDGVNDTIYVFEKEGGYSLRVRYSDFPNNPLYRDTIELAFIKTNKKFHSLSMKDIEKDGDHDMRISYWNDTRIDYFINDGLGNFERGESL